MPEMDDSRITRKRRSVPWEEVSLDELAGMSPIELSSLFPQVKPRLKALLTRLAHFEEATAHNIEAAQGERSSEVSSGSSLQ